MKIKLFIVTYNSKNELNNSLSTVVGTRNLEIFVINNHSNLEISPDFAEHVTVLHNQTRPDFSTGHLSRNWNQALLHGFRNLKSPDCDFVVCAQDDTRFESDAFKNLIELHKDFDLIQNGAGDCLVSYTPAAIRRVGLWDERFCNIGYQEADYFLRAAKFLGERATINDFQHGRVWNPIGRDIKILKFNLTGDQRGESYHIASRKFHSHSLFLFRQKWTVEPEFWSEGTVKRASQLLQNFILYPYFEYDVETLEEQQFLVLKKP